MSRPPGILSSAERSARISIRSPVSTSSDVRSLQDERLPQHKIEHTSKPTYGRTLPNLKVRTLVGYILAALVPTSFAWFVSFRELTLATGYVTYPLQAKHLIPYVDYFDPVPPLQYFEAQITAGGNFGLHNYMMLTLMTVPFFGIASFSLAKQYLNTVGALFLVTLTELLLLSERLEQVGGWNSQFFMLQSIGFVLFVNAVINCGNDVSNGISERLATKMQGIGCGVFLALTIIEKQTSALTIIVAALLVAPWLYWERREGIGRLVKRVSLFSIIGALPVFLYTLYFLFANHAFGAFVSDILSGGGKNPHFLSIFSN